MPSELSKICSQSFFRRENRLNQNKQKTNQNNQEAYKNKQKSNETNKRPTKTNKRDQPKQTETKQICFCPPHTPSFLFTVVFTS